MDCNFTAPTILQCPLLAIDLTPICPVPRFFPPAIIPARRGRPGCGGVIGPAGLPGGNGTNVIGATGPSGTIGARGSDGGAGATGSGSDCPGGECVECYYEP